MHIKLPLLLSLLFPAVLFAATPVSYVATADPNLNPDGTLNGNPVDIWTCDFGGGNAGSFFAAPSWAFYSITSQATATHTFDGGALATNQTVSLNFVNAGMASGHGVGINLLAGGSVVFSLYFTGGGGGNYIYTDSGGTGQDSGVGFSYYGTNVLSFTKTSTGYTAGFGGASTPNSWSGTLASNSVDQIQVFNDSHQNTGDNQVYWSSLQVAGVPEPSSYGAMLGVALIAIALKNRMRRRQS